MTTTSADDTASRVIAVLRAHEEELRAAGLVSLSLFGSVARGDATARSDVDLAATVDLTSAMDLFRLEALQSRISELLGRPADLLPEPVDKQRLQDRIDQDRRRVF